MANVWFEKANDFLDEAKSCFERKKFELTCFHSQQSAEFFLKGILVAKTGSHIFTHSLVELLEALEDIGVEISEDVYTVAEALEAHYIKSRYPSRHFKPYTEKDARRCIKYAERIIQFAKNILNEKG
ncbi:MAG: HEPN domain-containing protein [Candidatus Njordarchaeia archaeon]